MTTREKHDAEEKGMHGWSPGFHHETGCREATLKFETQEQNWNQHKDQRVRFARSGSRTCKPHGISSYAQFR